MERKELLNKVAYLTDNINKKVRKFRNDGLGNFYENKMNYATAKFDRKINLTMESGFLTKSKKELGKLTDKELEQLYTNLHNLQTNKDYGTLNRFKATEKVQLGKTANTLKSLMGNDKFNKLMGNMSEVELVKEFIKRKNEMTNARGGTYVSNQILMQMYLDLGNEDEKDQQDTQRAIAKMERARELMERNNVSMEGRRRNGNR